MAVLVHIKSVTLVTHKICDTFPSMMHYATCHSRFLNETELVIHAFQFFAGMALTSHNVCHPRISTLLLNHSQSLIMLTDTSWLYILFT